jgi:D-alanine-D-alanine ligase
VDNDFSKCVLNFKNSGKKLAFVYNVRHAYPDPNDLNTFLETDYDDPKSIEAVKRHLISAGFDILPIESTSDAEKTLVENKDNIELVFNYSEVILENGRKKQITSICEKHGIPHTGSSDKAQLLIRNKADAKVEMRKHGIPVVDDQVFMDPNEPLKPELHFPLIVKPIGQGSSAGITNKSVVNSEKELRTQLNEVITNFKDHAIVEPLLLGREFSVAMIGNPPTVLPIIEPNLKKLPSGYAPIDSLEVKWLYEEGAGAIDHLACPAKLDEQLKKTIEDTVKNVWNALEIKDLCRIDTRCDEVGNLFVLEINSPPGLLPPEITKTSYLPMAARTMGLEYDQLLQSIICSAMARYGL